MSVHHIIHDSLGGSWEIKNLLWICLDCHRKIHFFHEIPSGENPMNKKFLFEKKSKKRKQKFNNNSNANRRYHIRATA